MLAYQTTRVKVLMQRGASDGLISCVFNDEIVDAIFSGKNKLYYCDILARGEDVEFKVLYGGEVVSFTGTTLSQKTIQVVVVGKNDVSTE